MVVLFRLAVRMLAVPFRPRRGILEESVLTLRVWPNDLDLNLHLNNGRYLSLMDIGRMDLLARPGLLFPSLRRRWLPLLGEAKIRFLKPLPPFARFELRSRLLTWDEKWFYIEQVFQRNGEVMAIAHVRGLLRGPHGNVPPADILALGGFDPTPPEKPELVRRWREDGR